MWSGYIGPSLSLIQYPLVAVRSSTQGSPYSESVPAYTAASQRTFWGGGPRTRTRTGFAPLPPERLQGG